MMKTSLLLLVLSFPDVFSWVPPISNSWEPVQAMRARLGISYNYTPSLLHPELCRHISADECEEIDCSLRSHAQSHSRRFLQGKDQPHNPNLGTVKVLVLLTQFTDHTTDRTLIEKAVIEDLWNGDVKRWFSENSQGAYEIEPVVVDWMLTDNTEDYYSFDVRGLTPELQQAMYPLLNQLDATEGWDWSQFDSDGNGQLDAVVMMHSGYDAVLDDPDCQGRGAQQRIFSHAFASSADAWTSADGSVALQGYAVTSAFHGICDGTPFKPGLICHEYMHTMGLIDLYDETDSSAAEGVGAWDIMSNPYGHDNSGNPGFLSAWSREVAEWMTPEEIVYDGFYVLQPAETSNQAYKIDLQGLYPEYLLIENRQQISFDETLWDKGLMIYHIDDGADGMTSRGYPAQEGWPENGNHYRVAVLPKDGLYDLEQNVNWGDAGDMWLPGNELTPGMGGTVYPNTDSYQFGSIFEKGFTIRVVSQQANNDVVFEVTGLAPAPEGATNQSPPPDSSGATTPATPEPVPVEPATPETVPIAQEPTTAPPTTAAPETAITEPATTAPPTSELVVTDVPGGATTTTPATPMPNTTTTTAEPGGIHNDATELFTADNDLQASSGCNLFSIRTAWKSFLGLAIVIVL